MNKNGLYCVVLDQCSSNILVETQPFKIPTPSMILHTPYAPVMSRETPLFEPETIISTEKTLVIIGSIVFAAVLIGAVVMYMTLSRTCKGTF